MVTVNSLQAVYKLFSASPPDRNLSKQLNAQLINVRIREEIIYAIITIDVKLCRLLLIDWVQWSISLPTVIRRPPVSYLKSMVELTHSRQIPAEEDLNLERLFPVPRSLEHPTFAFFRKSVTNGCCLNNNKSHICTFGNYFYFPFSIFVCLLCCRLFMTINPM